MEGGGQLSLCGCMGVSPGACCEYEGPMEQPLGRPEAGVVSRASVGGAAEPS